MSSTPSVIKKIQLLLNGLDYPSDNIKMVVLSTTERLHYLLWSNDETYVGPLADGLQQQDYSVLVVLVSNWLMESYFTMIKNQTVLREDIEVFYDRRYLTLFSISLLKSVLRSGLIPNVNESDVELLDAVVNFVQTDVSDMLQLMEKIVQRTCCSNFRTTKITNELKLLSEKQGKVASSVSRMTR